MGAGSEGALLFLSPFFFPEPISTGKYNTEIAEGLRDAGIATVVVASEPLYPTWVPRPSTQSLPGIEVVRGGSWVRYPKAPLLRRLVLEMWYLCFLACKLPRRRKSTGAVIAVFPPVLYLPVSRAILRKEVKFVGIVHDLQSVFVEKSASVSRRILSGVVRSMERVALRSCDRLIFLSQSMATRAIQVHGLDAKRCAVHLPFASAAASQGSGQALAHLFPTDARHVVYAGALGEKQNPKQLLECFLHLTKVRQDVICHCFSRGPVFDELRKKYAGSPRVEFHDLVDEQDLPELFVRSDIQIVPQLFGTSEAALPSKLPNLIAAGVPVLAICDEFSEVGRIVLDAEAGSLVHSWMPAAVSTAVVRLLEETKGQSRNERRTKATAYVEQHFSLQRLVDDIAGFVRQGRPDGRT